MNPIEIYKQCEDYLFPKLGLSVRERSLYYHLLRHTHLEGRAEALVAILPLSKAIGVAESSVREDIRTLHARGCISIEDRSRNGHSVRVILPTDIPGLIPQMEPEAEIDLEVIDFFIERKQLVALLERENGRCFYCLKVIQPQGCELDHVISLIHGVDNSYRNIVCSCHDCNTTKQSQDASDFMRILYRKGVLSQAELEGRLSLLISLQAGGHTPDKRLITSAI